MPNKKTHVMASQQMLEFERALKEMAASKVYHTESSYSANSDLYPDNQMPFVDKHLHYIRAHPSTDPEHYLSNLRLMTRIR